jgi:hypothetical protein
MFKQRFSIDRLPKDHFSNRELLPRVCLSVTSNQRDKLKVKIVFNDYHRVAQSSLVQTTYTLKLFYLVFSENTTNSRYERVESNSIMNYTEFIDQNNPFEIDNLNGGVFYMIEVNFKFKHSNA